MLRRIDLHGRIFEYELTWKSVKNYNMRVRADGRILVSANRRSGIEGVECFIRANEPFLLRAMDRIATSREVLPSAFHYLCDGGRIPVLGRERSVCLRKGTGNQATLVGDTLLVTVRDVESEEKIRQAIRSFFSDQARRIIPSLCLGMTERFSSRGIDCPELRFRRMVSRWGSCCPSTHSITFNSFLLCAPLDCVEYVAAHEFAHFIVPNHSPAFYRILDDVMPDWKERKTLLEPYGYLLRQL